MSKGMARVFIAGNAVSAPKIISGREGKKDMASFTVAYNPWKADKAVFIPCIVFEKFVDYVAEAVKKGSRVYLAGRLDAFLREDSKYPELKVVVDELFVHEKPDYSGHNHKEFKNKETPKPHYMDNNPPPVQPEAYYDSMYDGHGTNCQDSAPAPWDDSDNEDDIPF